MEAILGKPTPQDQRIANKSLFSFAAAIEKKKSNTVKFIIFGRTATSDPCIQ